MKKYFFLATVVIASLSACNEEEINNQVDNQQAVHFTTAIANKAATRAAGTQWTAGDKIGIRMFDAASATVNNYDNVPYTIDAAGIITPADADMYYPLDGSNVGFLAYYPYKQGITDTYSLNIADQSTPEAIDLLHAKTTVDYNKRSTAVPLTFRHKLSKFVIKTQKGAGITSLAGMTVTTKCRTTASFNLKSGSLDNYDNLAAINFRTIKEGEHYEAIILPVASASAENSMTVRFVIGTDEYVWKVPTTAAFTAGSIHEWEITVSRTAVTGIQGTIAPWSTGPGGSGTAL